MATQLNAASRLRTATLELEAGKYDYDAEAFHKDMLKLGFVETSTGKNRTYAPGKPMVKDGWKGQVKLIEQSDKVPTQYGFLLSLRKGTGKISSYKVANKLRADLPNFLKEVKTALKG